MKDNVDLICSIGELAGLFEKTTSLENFLQTAVSIVAYHMRAAVCSVYLIDEKTGELVMTANQGLAEGSVGAVRLQPGEGITGTAVKELRPIREGRASQSVLWKSVPGIEEEKYQAFLAVPIVRGMTRIGALVVQDPVPDYFRENDTKALQAIAAQLATVIENAKLLMTLGKQAAPEPKRTELDEQLKFIRGHPGAKGVGIGSALVFGSLDEKPKSIACAYSRDDFDRALMATERQLEAMQVQMEEKLADVASLIFNTHILIIKDAKFSGAMIALIEAGQSPTAAIMRVVEQYSRMFASSKLPQLREKVMDVKDLGRRLLKNLHGGSMDEADLRGRVIIAEDVMPSDILRISAQKAEGLVLIGGGANTHVAILARSLQLPMAITENRVLLEIGDGRSLLLDGDQGTIYVDPSADVLANYRALMQAAREAEEFAAQSATAPATADGTPVRLMANINMLSEIPVALRYRAAGVGLYRSEFPFIVRNNFPSEEEQFRIYRKLLDDMDGQDVTLRTLDVGGDKMLSYFPSLAEANPFLGLRAIRFSLRYRDIFIQQLRALLRAGESRNLNIMFPLVSSVDDFLEARAVVHDCLNQLDAEGIACNRTPRLGAMIELPAAVEVVEELAREADFLSIGGNDLVQYMLAVDRTNEHIADLYVPHHPAVLRALARIARAADAAGKPLSFCGEMATNPKMLPFLIGIGLRRLSVEARQIPRIHKTLTTFTLPEARRHAAYLLTLGRISEVTAALDELE